MLTKIMILWSLVCFIATAADQTPAQKDASTKMTFVITAYGPFAGRGKNGSSTLLNSLREDPAFAQVTFHVLDVGWRQVDEFIKQSVTDKSITGIIGLGEGHPGLIAIECVGRNNKGGTDVFGVEEKSGPINGVASTNHNKSRLRYSINPELPISLPIVISNNAGDYLCNYLLYKCNDTAVKISGFIHLPPQGVTADEAYLSVVRPLVRDILLQNIPKPE